MFRMRWLCSMAQAPHIVHAPLQAPQEFIEKFNMIAPTDKSEHERQNYHAMVNFADAAVGNLTALLKSKGMWNDTLLVFSADNGGAFERSTHLLAAPRHCAA